MYDRTVLVVLGFNCIFFLVVFISVLYVIEIMRGGAPNLKDIVLVELGEVPENVSLRCGEEMLDSDDDVEFLDESLDLEEEQEQVQRVPTPRDRDLYSIEVSCPFCEDRLVFVTRASSAGIRQLQQVLVSSELAPVCEVCVSRYGLAHA